MTDTSAADRRNRYYLTNSAQADPVVPAQTEPRSVADPGDLAGILTDLARVLVTGVAAACACLTLATPSDPVWLVATVFAFVAAVIAAT